MESESPGGGSTLNALLVAVDGGAMESLAPLAAHLGCALADTDETAALSDTHWSSILATAQPSLLVVGTSDSARGRRIESASRRAARGAGVAIAAIEDFPGNYFDVAGGEASLLIVESDAAGDIARTRLGGRAPPLAVMPPARYDRWRARATALRLGTSERWAEQQRPAVLWAGQPETEDCLVTLEHVLPTLRACNARLIFKAHPRDTGYVSGGYRALLQASHVDCLDVTARDVDTALAHAPRLVVTQFSSLAIEAGFYGIPSVWALLPHAGGDRLEQKKRYRVPPLCAAGGAALATDATEVRTCIERSLADALYRMNLMHRFDAYCGVHEQTTPALAALLLALVATVINPK